MAEIKQKIYTVSEINQIMQVLIRKVLPSSLMICGQIGDFKRHTPSGHCYFNLKDEDSVLPCVMWAGSFKSLKFKPEQGMAIIAAGNIDVYPQGGKYQFYVEKMQPEGKGTLQIAFEQMVQKLEAKGYFDESHKKPIKQYPQRICIITSESGAAVEDIKTSIWSRWPITKLFLYPVPVQGEGAAEKIAKAIKTVNKFNKKLNIDVIIVGRGGGSLEDLWAFNEEAVAKAIYSSKIPIISAVGHEVDTTIADLVADARASTPTKAGVQAVPDYKEVLEQLSSYQRGLKQSANWIINSARQEMKTILASAAFRNPKYAVENRSQNIDEISNKLNNAIDYGLTQIKERLYEFQQKVTSIEPHRLIGKKNIELQNFEQKAQSAMKNIINRASLTLTANENRLGALNPKSVLKRGYSITINKQTGLLVKNSQDVKAGDILVTELAEQNLIESRVEIVQNNGIS
jgi:exodeoxyribonuclease VII large subunit